MEAAIWRPGRLRSGSVGGGVQAWMRGCVDAWMRRCVDSVVTVGNVTSGGMMSSAFGWLVRRNSEFRVQYSSTYTSYKKRV